MKLLHLADLHLGKTILEAPLIEEQQAFLEEMLEVVDQRKVDAVLLAGICMTGRSLPWRRWSCWIVFSAPSAGAACRCWPLRATTIPGTAGFRQPDFYQGRAVYRGTVPSRADPGAPDRCLRPGGCDAASLFAAGHGARRPAGRG